MTERSSKQQKGLKFAALIALCALLPALFILGAQPLAVNLIPEPFDKLAHWFLFAVLAVMFGMAVDLCPLRRASVLLLALLCALVVGAADELHQIALPGRSAGWDDFAADAAGAICGLWVLVRQGLVR